MLKEEVKNLSLTEKVNKLYTYFDIEKELEKKSKKHIFKLPWNKRLKPSALKKNYCLVFIIHNNLQLTIDKLPIIDDMIYIKKFDMYYHAGANYIFRYNNLPAILIQEWSLEPINPEMLRRKTLDEKMLAYPQKILITLLRRGQITQPKRGIGGWIIYVILGLVGVFIIYTIATGGLK